MSLVKDSKSRFKLKYSIWTFVKCYRVDKDMVVDHVILITLKTLSSNEWEIMTH